MLCYTDAILIYHLFNYVVTKVDNFVFFSCIHFQFHFCYVQAFTLITFTYPNFHVDFTLLCVLFLKYDVSESFMFENVYTSKFNWFTASKATSKALSSEFLLVCLFSETSLNLFVIYADDSLHRIDNATSPAIRY